ncbi:hypothetical protein J4412_01240 [Candidatus Pacearchaeota archaeon]|nr:MAG: hypothetical protein QJ16_C0004G0013 [archaeon GW2011_AR1]MBS3078114.1 hypothetical protein [Candidatus Pacearchaeota archaeon]HIH52583.1 hypothetical protein [Nanoarchaeota archaeon]
MNGQVLFNSILALFFLALSFKIDWLFIVGAVILIYINQKLLTKKGFSKL